MYEYGSCYAACQELADGTMPLDALLDHAADGFAERAQSPEAMAGLMARFSKTLPPWAQDS